VESKETKQGFALVIKEEVSPLAEISEKMKPLLEEFKGVVHDELLKRLPSMRSIKHHILKVNLPNLPLSDEFQGD